MCYLIKIFSIFSILVVIAAIYNHTRHNLTVINLIEFLDSTANNFIIASLVVIIMRKTKAEVLDCRVTNRHCNLLYNFTNIKTFKILASPGPTSLMKKPVILDIFITTICSDLHLYCSINNILDLNSDHSFVILIYQYKCHSSHELDPRPKLFIASTDHLIL